MKSAKLALGTLALLCSAVPSAADETMDRLEIMNTVQALFDAMAATDGPGAARVLLPEGRFVIVDRGDSGIETAVLDHVAFVERVAESEVPLIERTWDPEVRVDGDIASYRARYDFHSGTSYSHCGVDLFHLVRADAGWRITGGTFTREQNCPDNPLPEL
ncbi:MAG: nuclear transport factor 2 family protein [Pseudomonadales bacterium]|jgi:hypothetical protein|nr:nuclear transport factor 2 family protein [Pseudomonadales bacterium]